MIFQLSFLILLYEACRSYKCFTGKSIPKVLWLERRLIMPQKIRSGATTTKGGITMEIGCIQAKISLYFLRGLAQKIAQGMSKAILTHPKSHMAGAIQVGTASTGSKQMLTVRIYTCISRYLLYDPHYEFHHALYYKIYTCISHTTGCISNSRCALKI